MTGFFIGMKLILTVNTFYKNEINETQKDFADIDIDYTI
jgi:hypothetical protein